MSEPGNATTSSTLGRWGELGAVLAGVLFMAWGYIDADDTSFYFIAVVDYALGFIVPLLFLAGLIGLYARCGSRIGHLGELGFIFGFVGSGLGVLHHVHVEMGWPHVFNWLPGLWSGLALIGLAAIRTKALGGWSVLPLAMGVFGWVYYFTESGWVYYFTEYVDFVEARPVHDIFGVLFGLSWMALGYALRAGRVR
jgi:hypothetical protein